MLVIDNTSRPCDPCWWYQGKGNIHNIDDCLAAFAYNMSRSWVPIEHRSRRSFYLGQTVRMWSTTSRPKYATTFNSFSFVTSTKLLKLLSGKMGSRGGRMSSYLRVVSNYNGSFMAVRLGYIMTVIVLEVASVKQSGVYTRVHAKTQETH